jgi:Flp pilus assembly protein TadD
MAEEKKAKPDLEKEFGEIDEQIILKEGELSEEELAEKKKRNTNLSKNLNLNFSIPDPKIIFKEKSEKVKNKLKEHKDKIISYGLSALSLIIVISILIAFLNKSHSDEELEPREDELAVYTAMAFKKPSTIPTKESQVEELVKKANFLYQQGDKNEALKIYGRIATYNASLSYYNLGVARAKKDQCLEAVDAFDRAIQNLEHITPSAINAAVCSKKLNKLDDMKAYLDLAYKHLPEELDSDLYSYYYSLISFYRGNYFETFSSLKHRTSDYFEDEKNMMESRVHLLFENYGDSAEALTKSLQTEDYGSLGMIYANMGELKLAKDYIERGIEAKKFNSAEDRELMRLKYAGVLVDLKLGNVRDSGITLSALNDIYEGKLTDAYSLELSLQENMFDVQKAQKFFQKELQFSKYTNYQILLYFAPYKVFDAKKSINIIKKGSANIAIGDSEEATNYLEDGAKSSDVNKNIVLAVKEAFNKRLRIANKILREIEAENPKHAILHYDLGLTYAQLGDMSSAHSHFKKSFHLNSRDYLSGVFALMTGDLIGADTDKLSEVLKENLSIENETSEKRFYETLFNFRNGNFNALQDWLHNLSKDEKEDLLNLGLGFLITTILDSSEENRKENKLIARKIVAKLPNDILTHLLYLYSNFKDLDIKEFSRAVIHHFEATPLPLYDFYYGTRITQETFIKFHLLTGKLQELQNELEHYYNVELKNPEGIIQALALTMLYNKNYEKSYKLYNKLIDDFDVKDSRTLFLAGVSAVASKHYANAVALFELARMKNKMNLETRFALGLLYLEAKNFEAGGVLFKRFENAPFFSDFFDFNVKTAEKIESFYKNQ